MTRLAQIQEAIRQLQPQEQRQWREEESPGMLAAAEQGLRSLVEEPTIPVTELRRKINGWTTRWS